MIPKHYRSSAILIYYILYIVLCNYKSVWIIYCVRHLNGRPQNCHQHTASQIINGWSCRSTCTYDTSGGPRILAEQYIINTGTTTWEASVTVQMCRAPEQVTMRRARGMVCNLWTLLTIIIYSRHTGGTVVSRHLGKLLRDKMECNIYWLAQSSSAHSLCYAKLSSSAHLPC